MSIDKAFIRVESPFLFPSTGIIIFLMLYMFVLYIMSNMSMFSFDVCYNFIYSLIFLYMTYLLCRSRGCTWKAVLLK